MPLSSHNLRSSSLDHSCAEIRLDVAVNLPWVTLDGTNHRNALVIDIDHPDALGRWQAFPAAMRPILVLDTWSGRAHAIAPLVSPVCVAPDARAAPQRLADFAGRLMAAALGGTLLPHRSCTKWPWGREAEVIGKLIRPGPAAVHRRLHEETLKAGLCWHTEVGAGPLELRAVVAALESEWGASAGRPKRTWRRVRGEPDARGRNCTLFDLLRWWAYDEAELDGGRILDRAIEFNLRFPVPLPDKEVASISRSIAKFMQTQYGRDRPVTSRGRDRQLTEGLSPQEARSLSACRTNEQRRVATSKAILLAAKEMRAAGTRLTQSELASRAGVSIRTVRRCWADLEGCGPTPVPSCTERGRTVLYQVMPSKDAADGPPSPEASTPSLAGETAASRRRNALVAAEVQYFVRRAGSLLKRGFKMRRSTLVRWPTIVDPAVTAAWKVAEQALAVARRRAAGRKRRRGAVATRARLAQMARLRDPAARATCWAAEMARLDREWERKRSSLEASAEIVEIRRRSLRRSARVKAPRLTKPELDRLEADWDALARSLGRPIGAVVLQRYRAWAFSRHHKSWQKALEDAGHHPPSTTCGPAPSALKVGPTPTSWTQCRSAAQAHAVEPYRRLHRIGIHVLDRRWRKRRGSRTVPVGADKNAVGEVRPKGATDRQG